MWKYLSIPRLRRARSRNRELSTIDGGDRARPAGQGFFEGELDGGEEVVVDAFERGVFFLSWV